VSLGVTDAWVARSGERLVDLNVVRDEFFQMKADIAAANTYIRNLERMIPAHIVERVKVLSDPVEHHPA
jgi:hypothetical protein